MDNFPPRKIPPENSPQRIIPSRKILHPRENCSPRKIPQPPKIPLDLNYFYIFLEAKMYWNFPAGLECVETAPHG